MKVLWSWLLELCDLDKQPTVEEGAKALTRGGLEIEGVTDLGAGFTGVVVAEVVGKRPHPESTKLTLVDVITERGGAATQVVCGAPNVPEPGRKVLWAQVGATLPNGMTLAPKPVKGIVSPGMLCAGDELGLDDAHSGIIVLEADDPTPLGAPAQRALGLDDHLLEVNAPPNRGDVLGHLGIARELCAALRGRLVPPDANLADHLGDEGQAMTVTIADPMACPRYTARRLDGVKVGQPAGMLARRIAHRLRAVGVRSISNVVDVTNYVMFELGTPLHAFDANTLKTGEIRVSHARDGEKFTTLDKTERTLVPGDLLIRDGETGIALAGVMGGLETEVTAQTTRILLEAASFDAKTVRRTARRLGLHSEASSRFERGVDPQLAAFASARAAKLLCLVGGGTVQRTLADAYPGTSGAATATSAPAEPAVAAHAMTPGSTTVTVRVSRVAMLTGAALDAAACTDALTRLHFAVTGTGDVLEVRPPSARNDITREVDVIEEILRMVGYEQIVSTLPPLRQAPGVREPDRGDAVRQALAKAGAHEALTYAFQSAERQSHLGLTATDKRAQAIALRNPMSAEQGVMRTSLLPNLLAAVARNHSHGRPDVALFECGTVFLRRGESATDRPLTELADEQTWAAGVLAGKRATQLGTGVPYDAFDAKALAEVGIRAICGQHVAITTRASKGAVYLHPGVAGELVVDHVVVGWFGEVHPRVRARFGIEAPVFAFDLDLGKLPAAGPAKMQPIPRFPGTSRDVSLLLGTEIPAARVAEVIERANQPLVTGVRCLEDYRDGKLGAGKKSMLWSIAYRAADRTLTDAEVEAAHEAIVGSLVENLPAERR